MDEDRISRWKCIFCGSRQKKIIEHFSTANKKIGYTLHCCNCGHIDNFALTAAAIDLMTRANTGKLGTSCTDCGLLERDLYTCPATTCKYRKKFEKTEELVITPTPVQQTVSIEKLTPQAPTLRQNRNTTQDMIVENIRS